MLANISAGRMRHVVEFWVAGGGSDEYGDPLPSTKVFEARAEVQNKSGAQMVAYGTALTSSVITVMMWFDDRAKNNQTLKWQGVEYQVQHIMPDEHQKGMIITATVERK